GGGLDLFDPATGELTAYRDVDGLPSNAVYAMVEDDDGRLWLSTNKGLCRFDPETRTAAIYDLTNGLQSLQFNLGSALRTHTGAMLFVSWNGLYYFDPKAIQPCRFAPAILTMGLRFFGDPIMTDFFVHFDYVLY